MTASSRTAIPRRGLALGTEMFSLVVAGGGNVGEGGGGLECLFSFKLDRVDPEVLELQEEVDETDKLVFRRSRMFMNACIKTPKNPRNAPLLRVSIYVAGRCRYHSHALSLPLQALCDLKRT